MIDLIIYWIYASLTIACGLFAFIVLMLAVSCTIWYTVFLISKLFKNRGAF